MVTAAHREMHSTPQPTHLKKAGMPILLWAVRHQVGKELFNVDELIGALINTTDRKYLLTTGTKLESLHLLII